MVQKPTITIKPRRGWATLGLSEVWEYRDLLYFLLWRQVKGKYRQMALGPLWIVLNPLANMVIMTVIFGRLAKLGSEGIPYPIFVYATLLPWQLFVSSTMTATQSLVQEKNVIAKVYFPRLIIPIASALSALLDFLISFVILIAMFVWYVGVGELSLEGISFLRAVTVVPLLLLLTLMAGLGIGFWLAGLAVKFRDVPLALNFVMNIGKYVTPVAYSIAEIEAILPAVIRPFYQLNPMAVVTHGFRWSLLGVENQLGTSAVWAVLLTMVLFVTGIMSFRRTERTIVDLL